jgi:hypothetical protein
VDVFIRNSIVDAVDVQGSILEITERLSKLKVKELIFDGIVFDRSVPEDELEMLLAEERGSVQLITCRCKNHFVVKRLFRRMSKIEKVMCIMRK